MYRKWHGPVTNLVRTDSYRKALAFTIESLAIQRTISLQGAVNTLGINNLEMLALIGQPSNIDHTSPNAPEAMLIGGPLRDNPDQAMAVSPITYITPNDPPVMTVHGTEDRTIPYDQAVRLDAALRWAGVQSYFVTINGAGHGNFGTVADARFKTFFDKYLRGKNNALSIGAIDWKPR